MAKHTKRRTRQVAPAVLAGATAVGVSTTLVLGCATDTTAANTEYQLTATTVIGVGGWRDPEADRIQQKFSGELVPKFGGDGYLYEGLYYPAELPVDTSVEEGVPLLLAAIDEAPDGKVVVVSYSEGTIAVEQAKRELIDSADPPDPEDLEFVYIAAPFVPNGGIYARLPRLRLPGFTSTGPVADSPYAETFYTLEYDPVGDLPAYFNVLSLANSLAGLFYVHGDPSPDAVDLESDDIITTTGDDGRTYVFVRAEHLPLLQPARDLSEALQLTPFTEPFISAVEPIIRLGVDAGYTDRENENPDVPTQFSLVTPPSKIAETVAGLPGALDEARTNLVDGLSALTPSTSIESVKVVDRDKPKQSLEALKPNRSEASIRTLTPKRHTFQPQRQHGNKAKAGQGGGHVRTDRPLAKAVSRAIKNATRAERTQRAVSDGSADDG